MKKVSFLVLMSIVVLSFVSCKKKSTPEPMLRPSTMIYTSKDTTTINNLVNNYISMIEANNLRGAAEELYVYRNDSIFPLEEKAKSEFAEAYSHFHIYKCKVTNLILRSDKNNEVRIMMQIMPDGDIEKAKGVTVLTLNPVYKDGKWYMTLRDENAEGVEKPYSTNNL